MLYVTPERDYELMMHTEQSKKNKNIAWTPSKIKDRLKQVHTFIRLWSPNDLMNQGHDCSKEMVKPIEYRWKLSN